MLGIKTKKLKYCVMDDVNVIEEKNVFFFGNSQAAEKWSVYDLGADFAGNASNKENIKFLIENLSLRNLLVESNKWKETLGNVVNGDHILQKKMNFIKELINELAVSYLKFINRLMWSDRFSNTVPNNADNRWQETGVSFDTALTFVSKLNQEMNWFFLLMIDLRFNPNLLKDKLKSDYDSLLLKYKDKTGQIQKNKK